MKLLTTIIAFFILPNIYGQVSFLNNLKVQENNFFYKDSINGQITFGDYEPTGIVSMKDGSLIVSTKFSITFPGQYTTPITFNAEYFEREKIFSQKSHVCSGSLFKLDSNYQKQWEIIFKERRVVGIKKLSDENILIVGERTDMKQFWIAKISPDGKILFEKSYKFKRKPSVENMEIDSLDNIHVLLSAERLYPIRIRKYYGRIRLEFFKESEMENDLYLLKISPNGKIKWQTTIDNRKNISTYGYDLVIKNGIYISTRFSGFVKTPKGNIKSEGKMIYEICANGKIKTKYPIENKRIFSIRNQLLFATTARNDSLVISQKAANRYNPIETIIFNNDIEQFWTEKALSSDSNNYFFGTHHHNLGCLMVKLDKQNRYLGYWKDSLENISSFVDATIKPDNSVVIIATHYSLLNSTDSNKKYSIKIMTIK